MLIAERIRLQKNIWQVLKQKQKRKQATASSVKEALEQIILVQNRLTTFNKKHPVFSKLFWIIDQVFAFIPLKAKRLKLIKLSQRIRAVTNPVVIPPVPLVRRNSTMVAKLSAEKEPLDEKPQLERYETFLPQFLRYHFETPESDTEKKKAYLFGIQLCSFAMECERFFSVLKELHEKHVENDPHFEEADEMRKALETTDQFGTTYSELLQSLNQDKLHSQTQQQLFATLVLNWKSVKESLADYPEDSSHQRLPKLIKRVDHTLQPELIAAKTFLDREIKTIYQSIDAETARLATLPVRSEGDELFKEHDARLRKVIENRISSYRLYLRNYVYLLESLVKAPEISTWELCTPHRSEMTAQANYAKYVKQALEAQEPKPTLFVFWSNGVEEEIERGLQQRFRRLKDAQALISKG